MSSSDDSDDDFSDDYDVEEMIIHNIINNNQQERRHNAQLNAILRLLVPDDHRNLPRSARREFDHVGALRCIRRDYLGLPNNPMTPIFIEKDFEMMFCLSKARVERMIQDIGNSGVDFFVKTTDATGKQGASIEARVLLQLKTVANGVPPHTFSNYFQMSKNMACQKISSGLFLVVPGLKELRPQPPLVIAFF
jgi:hypothetical protein